MKRWGSAFTVLANVLFCYVMRICVLFCFENSDIEGPGAIPHPPSVSRSVRMEAGDRLCPDSPQDGTRAPTAVYLKPTGCSFLMCHQGLHTPSPQTTTTPSPWLPYVASGSKSEVRV